MKIYGKCKKCKQEIGFKSYSPTRVEFAMNEGEKKILDCKSCGAKSEIHVDQLYAKESKLAKIISGLIFLVGTPLIILLTFPVLSRSRNHYVILIVGGLLLLPVIAYSIIKRQEQTRVSAFNRSKLKGRIHNIG